MRLRYAFVLILFVFLSCEPDTHSMWNCFCDVEAQDHSGTILYPMWCDDAHDQYETGALMVSYCWAHMSIWWDPGEFICACECVEIEATTKECYTGVLDR